MELEIDTFEIDYHFASPIFRLSKPEFLNSVTDVFNEYIDKQRNNQCRDNVYPGIMTELLSPDERVEAFLKYISDISWDVLNKQGYNMDLFYTDASEMWGQYHPYLSSMEKHSHGHGTYLTGFYFLNTPENSSKMFVHDPSSIKTYVNLPIRENAGMVSAYTNIFYEPKPGDLIFTNSWVEHSFSRNASQQPYNFIHINVKVVPREQNAPIIV